MLASMKNGQFIAVTIFLTAAFSAHASLLTNGDFETVDGRMNLAAFGTEPPERPLDELSVIGKAAVYDSLPGGWIVISGGGVEVQADSVLDFVAPHSGNYYVELDSAPFGGDGSNSAIAQDVVLDVGWYTLSFWYFPRAISGSIEDNLVAAYLDNVASPALVVADGFRTPDTVWGLTSADFYVGSGGTHSIILAAGGTENQYGGLIDSVSLTRKDTLDTNSPEPSSFVLIGCGLLGLALARRRQKK